MFKPFIKILFIFISLTLSNSCGSSTASQPRDTTLATSENSSETKKTAADTNTEDSNLIIDTNSFYLKTDDVNLYITEKSVHGYDENVIVMFHQKGFNQQEYKNLVDQYNQETINTIQVDLSNGGYISGEDNKTVLARGGTSTSDFDALEKEILAVFKMLEESDYTRKILMGSAESADVAASMLSRSPRPFVVNSAILMSPQNRFSSQGHQIQTAKLAEIEDAIPFMFTSPAVTREKVLPLYSKYNREIGWEAQNSITDTFVYQDGEEGALLLENTYVFDHLMKYIKHVFRMSNESCDRETYNICKRL